MELGQDRRFPGASEEERHLCPHGAAPDAEPELVDGIRSGETGAASGQFQNLKFLLTAESKYDIINIVSYD